jgi:4-amino-4-deoxy-L-arabinose transferase-like glycosyltransferase
VTDEAAAFALCCLFPPWLLSARTGFPNILLPYLLFWSAIALALAFRRTGRAAFLYGLGIVAACALLNPYPPLLALPILVLILLARRPGLLALLKNPNSYAAAGVTAGLYLGIVALLARSVEMPLGVYRGLLAAFRGMRGGSSVITSRRETYRFVWPA